MPKLENPLNAQHGKGKDRIKREAGTYFAISNGMYYGKREKGEKKSKDNKSISKGDRVKLSADQATGLSECIITEKEYQKFLDKSSKGMTTKSLSGAIGKDD